MVLWLYLYLSLVCSGSESVEGAIIPRLHRGQGEKRPESTVEKGRGGPYAP